MIQKGPNLQSYQFELNLSFAIIIVLIERNLCDNHLGGLLPVYVFIAML